MWGENSSRRVFLAGMLAMGCLSSPAGAQTADIPSDVTARISALDRTLDPSVVSATKDIYRPLQPKPPFPHVRVHRNLSYGPDPLNRLDVFVPEPLPDSARPVLLFVHGGGYVGGDKSEPAGTFYDNVGRWAAKNGMIGVNIDYRLAPQASWPAAIEDIGQAVAWAIQNVAPFGGDPERIFLMGHSSGATHVADYISHSELQPPFGAGISAAILVSGVYDLTAHPLSENEKRYFGTDAALYAERSSMPEIAQSRIPLLVAAAQIDIPRMLQQAETLNKAACAEKNCPRFLILPKHNHISAICSINTADKSLTNAILGFIKAH